MRQAVGAIVAAVKVSSAGARGLLSPSPTKGTSGSTPLVLISLAIKRARVMSLDVNVYILNYETE